MRIMTRIAPALATAALLTVALTGIASANSSLLSASTYSYSNGPNIVSKTIDTEAGNCTPAGGAACASAAVYGANGFSGTILYDAAGVTTLWDYMCVHTPGTGSFVVFGGTYTISVYNGTTSLGSTTYTLTGGQDCSGYTNYAATKTGITFTVPASKTVSYTVSLAGVTAGSNAQATFASYNSILNAAFSSCNHVHSYSVPPPTNFIIPEAPFAVLLPISAGLFAAAFVMRRSRKASEVAA